jgi:hypothetical protein
LGSLETAAKWLASTVAKSLPFRSLSARNGLKSPGAPGSISRFHWAIR